MAASVNSTAVRHLLFCVILPAVLSLASARTAIAAEPFVTDDAAVLERGHCKVEVGNRGHSGGREFWLRPACNLFLNLEVQVSRVAERAGDEGRSTANEVEVKGLWREIERDGYGLGWVLNSEVGRHPGPGQRRTRQHSALLLASYPVLPDRLTLHANLGGRWEREERRGGINGGFLAELELNSQVALLAEVYGSSRTRRGYQAGVRLTLVPDHVDLSVTRGGDDSNVHGRRYWAVSVEITSPNLMP